LLLLLLLLLLLMLRWLLSRCCFGLRIVFGSFGSRSFLCACVQLAVSPLLLLLGS